MSKKHGTSFEGGNKIPGTDIFRNCKIKVSIKTLQSIYVIDKCRKIRIKIGRENSLTGT